MQPLSDAPVGILEPINLQYPPAFCAPVYRTWRLVIDRLISAEDERPDGPARAGAACMELKALAPGIRPAMR
ncbi:hypothetical protein GCM10009680_87230 [Streptomyces yatensis]|uniref:Uncharacterized protein n=1 Tax=Streptomyces yatensis TaxID=155177 RepID=A0ABN2JNP4_9ACTN